MTIPVRRCCQAAELALKLGQADDAVALCRHVLAHYRWHLWAHLLLGQAFLEQENWGEAAHRFQVVALVDPGCAEAHSGLAVVAMAQGRPEEAVAHLARAFENAPDSDEVREALRQALSEQAGRPLPPPGFTPACVGYFYLRRGLFRPAAEAYAVALHHDPHRSDLHLAYATALWQAGLREQALNLCQPFLRQRPRPPVALLLVAVAAFQRGETSQARKLWQEAHAWDPDDTRARALLGSTPGLPFSSRPAVIPSPERPALVELVGLAAQVDAHRSPSPPGPAARELAAYAQQKHLAGSGGLEPQDPDLRRFRDTVEEVRERLFEQAPAVAAVPFVSSSAKERRPAEVILTWKGGLHSRFGPTGAGRVEEALQSLAQAAQVRGVGSRLVYLDEPPYPDLPRPQPDNPDEIKRFLDELDRRLAQEGLDLHYLLLVGGDDLVPFARLPNPGEDDDEVVPSDNLYASRDPTYLIPERAVGRIPDDGSSNPAFLLEQLHLAAGRLRGEVAVSRPAGCLGLFLPWPGWRRPTPAGGGPPQSRFGLSAQVWAAASEEVLGVLPGKEPLYLCPPTCRESILGERLGQASLAYFNLHGAADSPNWYGQRDLTSPGTGPLMPVAFSPGLIPAGEVEGVVVYTEACYGAHIVGKDAHSSLALRFLAEGALGFVGSTVISYGVSVPPLTDADLLGLLFWQELLQGRPLGDALLQAKLDFTQEMYRRQGYLDGDDMKTLLEFVLYGDPLAAVEAVLAPKVVPAVPEAVPTPPVLCEKPARRVALHQLSDDLVDRVRRSIVWLQQDPEIGLMQVTLRAGCSGEGCNGHCKVPKGTAPLPAPEALVFTSRRELSTEDGCRLPQVARVVVDERGRIVKMALTR